MGQQYGPFETRVQIIERVRHFADLMIRNDDPNVSAYRIYGASTLNDAYGNPTGSGVGGAAPAAFIPYLGLQAGFRSPMIIKRGLGRLESRAQLRRMSRIAYDPDDYASAAVMPAEEGLAFIRTQEFAITAAGFRTVLGAVDTGAPVLGPIVVLPTAGFYGSPNAPLTLAGIAPANTTAVAGANTPLNEGMQAPNPMHVVLPRPSGLVIRNLDAVNDLLYSFALGHPMLTVAAATSVAITGGVKEILLAGEGATSPAFELSVVVNLGVEL